MKLAAHSNSLQTNTSQVKSQGFTIGDASVIIDILRNRLYEKKIQTTVQEYISNSRDGCREAGKPDNAMEIGVPNHLSPAFRVRDYGIGITPERMADVFIKYGASTKRGDNIQTGGLGIGGKSFFSYADSFSIITYLDGIRRSYIAHIGESNAGHLDLVSTEQTKEGNGVEILGAVKPNDINEFRDAIFRAIYFWTQKPVFKGITDTPTTVSGYKIGDIVEIIDSRLLPSYIDAGYDGEPLAVIDGIPYVISEKLLNKCKTLKELQTFTRQKVMLKFGNGVIEVAASRESIADSIKSVNALEKMAQKVMLEVKTHIDEMFGKVQGPKEYVQTYRLLNSLFKVADGFAKYGSYEIKNDAICGDVLKKVKMTDINCLGRYGRGRINKITKKEIVNDDRKRLNLDIYDHIFFFKGQESDLVKNKRVREYFSGPNTKMLLIEVMPTTTTDPKTKVVTTTTGMPELDTVITDFGVKDFQSIKIPVVAKVVRAKVERDKTEFCVHVLDGSRYQYTTLAKNDGEEQKWLYVEMGEKGWDIPVESVRELVDYMKTVHDVRLCGIADRALKIIKGNNNFAPLKDWLDKFKPTKKDINYAKDLEAQNKKLVNGLGKSSELEDERLIDLLKEYKAFAKNMSEVSLPPILLAKVKEEKEFKDFTKQDEAVQKLITKEYKLLEEVDQYTRADMVQEYVCYANAKFNK